MLGGLQVAVEQQQLARLRWISKKLFVSQYRVEVAEAVRNLEDGWTIRTLERKIAEIDELPHSCIVKEVSSLRELDFVQRANVKTEEGFLYSRVHPFPGVLDPD